MFDKDTLQHLYRYAYSLTCDEPDAYDLLQSTLEKFLKSDVSVEKPQAYVKKMIYHRFIDNCRREKIIQFENLEEAVLPADFDVQTLEELHINKDMAKHILLSLEPDERELMYNWAIEGFSTSEIAEKIEKPRGTVLSKIYRMRKKIIERFNGNSDEVVEAGQ